MREARRRLRPKELSRRSRRRGALLKRMSLIGLQLAISAMKRPIDGCKKRKRSDAGWKSNGGGNESRRLGGGRKL
jgi:hypothetical protein